MTIQLRVIDRNGNEHELEAETYNVLMDVLRDVDYGVTAICGGMCACATCHVYVDSAWLERLPPPQGGEIELISGLQHCSANSRLSCQLQLSEALDGLRLTLAPEE